MGSFNKRLRGVMQDPRFGIQDTSFLQSDLLYPASGILYLPSLQGPLYFHFFEGFYDIAYFNVVVVLYG